MDGQASVIGGTSAVAPLYAGLIALLQQANGGKSFGFLPPLFYALPTGTFKDITQGTNGAFQAGAGWDGCTGLGSPNGQKLLAALTGGAPTQPPPVSSPPSPTPPPPPTTGGPPVATTVDEIQLFLKGALVGDYSLTPRGGTTTAPPAPSPSPTPTGGGSVNVGTILQIILGVLSGLQGLGLGKAPHEAHAEMLGALQRVADAHGLTLGQLLTLVQQILALLQPVLAPPAGAAHANWAAGMPTMTQLLNLADVLKQVLTALQGLKFGGE